MYLLFIREGESAKNQQLTTGRIEKMNGSQQEFAVIPETVKKLDFEYGDKVVCVHGTMMMIVHLDTGKHVKAIHMNDHYGMPYHEVSLTEEFMERHKREQAKLALTGVNHRVIAGRVIR